MRIPSDKNWTQFNSGDIFGVLHETQNITLDEFGKVRLSRKAFNRYNSTDDADMGYILGLTYYNGQYLALTDDEMFRFDLGGTTVNKTTLTTDVGLNSDIQVIYNRAYITTNDNVDYYDGSITAGVEVLTADVPHPMAVFDSLPTYKLAIGNGNTVILLDSSNNQASVTLTLPEQYEVTTLAYRNAYLYVGTRHTNGGEAKVFVWDASSNNANSEIPIGASQVYSIIPYKNTVAFITNMGQLLTVSGNTPGELGALPVFYHPDAIWDDGTNVAFIGKVMHRGMVAVGDLIYLNVNGTVDSGFIPEMKHGLWVYDPRLGLYHRSFHSLDRSVLDTPANLSSSVLTTTANHNLKTGDFVYFRSVGSLTGIQIGTKYYVNVQSANTIKLAVSRKALQAGNFITLGGSIGVASLHYVPNTDWGGGFTQYQGAITAINPLEPVFRGWDAPVIWGSRIGDFSGNAFYSLNSLVDAWNIGRFTTQRIYSNNLSDTWKKLVAFIDGIHLDNEKVIIKYKSGDVHGYPTSVYQGTWASATTITSVSSTQDEDQWSDLEVGDELTLVDGVGRGYTTHITNIAVNGTDYTITVDESIGSNTFAVYFYADKFKKLGTYTNSRPLKDVMEETINAKSPWVQFRIEMRGFEPSVSHLDLTHSVDKSAI